MPVDEAKLFEKKLTDAIFSMEDELYMVVNSRLQSNSTGIRYRTSPDLDAIDKRNGSIVKFGQIIEGISWPEGWLLVDGFGKRKFLPKMIDGIPVLQPVKLGQGTQDTYDDSGDEWQVFEKDPESELPPGSTPGMYRESAPHFRPVDPSKDPKAKSRQALVKRTLTRDEEELMEVAGSEVRSKQILIEGLVALRWRLEKLGSDSNVNARTPDGYTPLMLAARRGNIDYCVVLVRAGADPALRSPEGLDTPDLATWKPCKALLRALRGDGFESQDLLSALDKLQPEVRRMSEELAKAAAAKALHCAVDGFTKDVPQAVESESRQRRGGVQFRVVCHEVPINDEPSTASEELTLLLKDDVIEVFGYDQTRTWARVKIELPHGTESGWVQIQSDVKGELIKPMK